MANSRDTRINLTGVNRSVNARANGRLPSAEEARRRIKMSRTGSGSVPTSSERATNSLSQLNHHSDRNQRLRFQQAGYGRGDYNDQVNRRAATLDNWARIGRNTGSSGNREAAEARAMRKRMITGAPQFGTSMSHSARARNIRAAFGLAAG